MRCILNQQLQHHRIVEVRTAGLWAAIQVESSDILHEVIARCLDAGLILDWFLFDEKSIRMAPPLTITKEELLDVCNTIVGILDKV